MEINKGEQRGINMEECQKCELAEKVSKLENEVTVNAGKIEVIEGRLERDREDKKEFYGKFEKLNLANETHKSNTEHIFEKLKCIDKCTEEINNKIDEINDKPSKNAGKFTSAIISAIGSAIGVAIIGLIALSIVQGM